MARLAIDASTLRSTGGMNHLRGLLAEADPPSHGFEQVRLWGGGRLVGHLPERPWLSTNIVDQLDSGLLSRMRWKATRAADAVAGSDLVFSPDSTMLRIPDPPVVTMAQNLLPFRPREARRYGLHWSRFRLWTLRHLHGRAIQASDGVLFPTHHAKDHIQEELEELPRHAVVPYGIDTEPFEPPTHARSIKEASEETPLRLLYVSAIDVYKHHQEVATAVHRLREDGLPVEADFVGAPVQKRSHRRLREQIQTLDPDGDFLHLRGFVEPEEINAYYRRADCFVMASSCETFSLPLLEAAAAGLPIACSRSSPGRELLGDGVRTFDCEDPGSIYETLRDLLLDDVDRLEIAKRSQDRAEGYSWQAAAQSTLDFFQDVLENP